MLNILSFPGTRGIRITWAAEEIGIEYQYQTINLYAGEHKSPEFLKISPMGKVPVINDDGFVMAESGAIVTYLADRHGKLIPSVGSQARGLYEQAMYFVLTELEQPLWTMGKHKFALPEDKRIPAALELGQWEFQKALNIFSQLLADKQYILGDEFSVADIVAGHTLSWAQGFKQSIAIDNVEAYAERVLSRPALARAREVEAESKSQLT
jgi:glutathione S-transferase